jgi:hypothetical protein
MKNHIDLTKFSGKLKVLLDIEGWEDELEAFQEWTFDSIVPGICMNKGCEYTAHYEPDQSAGWCEDCKTNTVVSGLILGHLM